MSAITTLSDEACLLGLTSIEGLSNQTLLTLLAHFSEHSENSIQAVWQAPFNALRPLIDAPTCQAIEAIRKDADTWQRQADAYAQQGIHLLPISHAQYPKLLREIYDAPVLLFIRGNINSLTGKTLAVVGTRRMSEYGKQVTTLLVDGLKRVEATIVSGLAEGIDGVAHQTALNKGMSTVAVFGCGINKIFPAHHKKLAEDIVAAGGALVSEFPLDYPADRYTFPKRNRIVAGLSYGVLVVEGPFKSGALITARLAAEESRTVFVVPGNILSANSQGPLSLLKTGAIPVTAAEDIYNELKWLETQPKENLAKQTTLFATLPTPAQQVLEAIAYDPMPVYQLEEKAGLPVSQLSHCLTLLELEGLITMLPGAKVCRR